MDWSRQDRENGKALRRIIALLLALAGLAEHASGRSRPVRCLVLLALRSGEAVARDYVAGLAGTQAFGVPAFGVPAFGGPGRMPDRHDGDDDNGGMEEALRLARVFRALAAALAALPGEAAPLRAAGAPAARSDPLAGPAVPIRDSS